MIQWQPHGLYGPWNSPGQDTGVGSRSLLQGNFPIQGLNPGLPHYGQIFYQLSHKGSPRILEWVAYSFSRGSSQPRNRTRVSCIAGRFFTNRFFIREAHRGLSTIEKYSKNISKQFTEKKMQMVTKLMITCQLCQQGKVQIKAMMRKVFFFFLLSGWARINPVVKNQCWWESRKMDTPWWDLAVGVWLAMLFTKGSRCSCWHLRSADLLVCPPTQDSVPQKQKHLPLKARLQGCGQSTVFREQNPEAKQVHTCVGKFLKLRQLPLSRRIPSIYYNGQLYFLLVTLQNLQDLSSPTRDWTQALALKALSPNHWTIREFPAMSDFRLKCTRMRGSHEVLLIFLKTQVAKQRQ